MRAYIDSSVLLRVALQSPNPLAVWDKIDHKSLDLAFATHDDKLAKAARAVGFQVLGV